MAIRLVPVISFLAAAAAIFDVSWGLVHSPSFAESPDLIATGITFDATITLSLAYYVLIARTYSLRRATLIPVLIIGLAIATRILPAEHRGLAAHLRLLPVALELAITGAIFWNISKIVSDFQTRKAEGSPFPSALERALGPYIPNPLLLRIFTTELSILRYSILGWFDPLPAFDSKTRFSYHRGNLSSQLLAVFIPLIALEAGLFHLILAHSRPGLTTLHWIVCGYSVIWLMGVHRAMRLLPIEIAGGELRIRQGISWSGTVPLSHILRAERAHLSNEPEADAEGYAKLSLPGGEDVLLTLSEPVTLQRIFGLRKTARKIQLTLDEPNAFLEALHLSHDR
ncbi:MAG: hypothetical protein ACXVBW_06770 [Bdellovibrionota bacterium]